MNAKFELSPASNVETELFYSSIKPERSLETGCIGHFRADFGKSGDEFWNTWTDHNAGLKSQNFKDEFDTLINTLRGGGILESRAAMSKHCANNPQAGILGGSIGSFGFRVKTDDHVYYLRCNPSPNEYNLYCYAYERGRLEKCFPALTDTQTQADELKDKLVKAAEYIIETSARETTTGNYVIESIDIPPDIISLELFSEHIQTIAEIMREYESVAIVDVSPYDSLDTAIYLDYCPNFKPEADQLEDYPPGRETLDPLGSKRKIDGVPISEITANNRQPVAIAVIHKAKPTLMQRLEDGKRKAAGHEKPDKPQKSNHKEERA
jgi:hypothetical protein